MTTHLRGRAAQAGALLAMVVGGIAMTPAVALAKPPDVQITNMPTEVPSGGTVTMKYKVTANPADGATDPVSAEITVSGQKSCSGACSQRTDISPGGGTELTATLTMPTVDPGTTKKVTINITVAVEGENPGSTSQSVTVQGPDKPATVTQVSGKVKSEDGKGLSGVQLLLLDSSGHRYDSTTNGSGGYSFISSDSRPITPGTITLAAAKEGFEGTKVTIQADAGRSVTRQISMKETKAAPSSSPSASVSVSASTDALDPIADKPSIGPLNDAGAETKKADSGSGSTLFVVLGGLLVAAGVGAIVLVLMRRRAAAAAEEEDGDVPAGVGSGSGGVLPPSQVRFNDATRVAAPMAPVRDATMIAPRAGGGGTLGDAPTMVQQVEDEFPDPYGAPLPQQGGSYQGAGGWDNQAGDNGYHGGYDEPAPYGQAPQDNGYGAGTGTYGAPAQAGAYGGQQRYDEPTGMYRPDSGQDGGYNGYDQGGYAADQGGYDAGQYGYDQGQGGGGYQQAGDYGDGYAEQGGYGSWGPQGAEQGTVHGGPQAGNGYGPAAAPAAPPAGGTYGAPPQQQYAAPQGGYDQGGYQAGYDHQGGGQTGYDQTGYDQGGGQQGGGYGPPAQGGYDQGGYDQGGAYGHGGYEQQPGGGYDQGGTYGTPAPAPAQGGTYGAPAPAQGGGYGEQPNHQGGQFRQEEPSHPGQRRSLDWMDN